MDQRQSPKEFLEKLRREENLREVSISPEDVRRIYGADPDAQYLVDLARTRSGRSYPQELFEEIISTLPGEDRARVRNEIAFGELLIRNVNATVWKAGEGYFGYVIIINRGLTSLFFHITKLLLARTATQKYLELAYNIEFSPCLDYQPVVDSILGMLHRYHEGGIPEPPLMQRQLLLDEPRRNLLAFLHVNSVSFVIAHELGHYFCGHLRQPQLSKEHEFEADVAALSILLNKAYLLGDDREITGVVTGALLALSIIEMIEKTGFLSSVSHPFAHERIDKIRKTFGLNKIYFEIADPLIEITRGFSGHLVR